jgi:hypothetical protein
MKFIYILCSLILSNCNTNNTENTPKSNDNKEIACPNEKQFGDISLCLIEMEGMTECYSNPKVTPHINEFRYEGNEILGIYFNDETFARIDSLGTFSYDDYFKVYAVKQLKGVRVGKNELDKLTEMMESNSMKQNWSEIKTKFENEHKNISLDQPIMLESYKPDERIRSFVFLMKLQTEVEEKVMVMTINMIEIKERLIYYAYYKDYKSEASIDQAKSISDNFGFKLMDEN